MNIRDIISDDAHRPWAFPTGPWAYYQEWNHALFLHWEIPLDVLRPHVPALLHIDLFGGKAYVSLVAFTMQRIRPRYLPALAMVSDFHEINLRTYIDNDGKKGVYFLSMEAGKSVSAFLANKISGLPYVGAKIKRETGKYHSRNVRKDFSLDVEFEVKDTPAASAELDKWLVERYCLYMERKAKIYRYDVHHRSWKLKQVAIKKLDLRYKIGNYNIGDLPPALVHYSDGVQVLAWKKETVKKS